MSGKSQGLIKSGEKGHFPGGHWILSNRNLEIALVASWVGLALCCIMKIGFQLKGSTKRKVLVGTDSKLTADDNTVKVEAILSIEDNQVQGIEIEKGPLIIPLQPPLNPTLSIDEIAAQELLAEAKNEGKAKQDSGMIIGPIGNTSVGTKKQPLLLANVAPELLNIEDDVVRYKMDVSMRPEDIDAKSESYVAVPIEEFGAALLRGMGWEGPTADSEEKGKKGYELVVRESRLGLGATAKPPDESHKKGRNTKNNKITEEWKKKAEEALKNQKLKVGDIVWLRDPLYVSQKGRVTAVKGVPGLDRIRVTLNSIAGPNREPKTVDVKRTDAVLMTEDSDLSQMPGPAASPRSRSPDIPQSNRAHNRDEEAYDSRDSNKERCRSKDRYTQNYDNKNGHLSSDIKKRHREEPNDSRGSKKRDSSAMRRDRHGEGDNSRSAINDHRKDHNNNIDANQTSEYSEKCKWVCPGIKVRVISEKVKCRASQESCYLKKFDVIRLSEGGLPVLHEIGGSLILDDVKEKYLENVLPAIGGRCVVLSGKFKGRDGILREKDKLKGELAIELTSNRNDQCTTISVSLEGAAALSED